MAKPAINYILHINGFYDRISHDYRLNPSHISFYFALFQYWNRNRFKNPISIARSEIMKISKIGSHVTYLRCLKELQNFGYITYIPSKNPLRGSLVNMFSFETSSVVEIDQEVAKNKTSLIHPVEPFKNIINIKNNLNNLKVENKTSATFLKNNKNKGLRTSPNKNYKEPL